MIGEFVSFPIWGTCSTRQVLSLSGLTGGLTPKKKFMEQIGEDISMFFFSGLLDPDEF